MQLSHTCPIVIFTSKLLPTPMRQQSTVRILLLMDSAKSIMPTIDYLMETTDIDAIAAEHPAEITESLLHSMDTVIVSLPLLAEWWAVESRLTSPLSIPRLIGTRGQESLTKRQIALLGFDGQIGVAQPIPPWEWATSLRQTLAATETRGTREPIDPSTLQRMVGDFKNIALADSINARILSLLALGMFDRQIASVMCLSTQSVKNRISKMLRATDLPNRTALAIAYLRSLEVEGAD